MRMGWIDSAEGGEELSALELKIKRQTGGLQKRFLYLHVGVVIVIEFENNIRETLEVGINRAIKCELDVSRVKSALHRIMIADFNPIEMFVARVGEGEQSVERDVH